MAITIISEIASVSTLKSLSGKNNFENPAASWLGLKIFPKTNVKLQTITSFHEVIRQDITSSKIRFIKNIKPAKIKILNKFLKVFIKPVLNIKHNSKLNPENAASHIQFGEIKTTTEYATKNKIAKII